MNLLYEIIPSIFNNKEISSLQLINKTCIDVLKSILILLPHYFICIPHFLYDTSINIMIYFICLKQIEENFFPYSIKYQEKFKAYNLCKLSD